MTKDQIEIQALLDEWASAIRSNDLDAVVRDRSPDILIFDVPEPLQAKGIDAYRETWEFYFGGEGSRTFELKETQIVASSEVAWVSAILRCTASPEPAGRLTLGLRKRDGRWTVEHEHHSFPLSRSEVS